MISYINEDLAFVVLFTKNSFYQIEKYPDTGDSISINFLHVFFFFFFFFFKKTAIKKKNRFRAVMYNTTFFCFNTIQFNVICILVFPSKLFHVRPVTQGDVIRAEAKDIPRIFQVIYPYSKKDM